MIRKITALQVSAKMPDIRPGRKERAWMDDTSHSFAYRCLPLTAANQHGWEILLDCSFEARWDGGSGMDAVQIRMIDHGHIEPMSHFGSGTITFHVPVLFKTEPEDVGLIATGPPNWPRDAIYPLTGLIETGWSPFTFTMNWIFTRPGRWVKFQKGEPFCFVYPVNYMAIEKVETDVQSIWTEPKLAEAYMAWREQRNSFNDKLEQRDPDAVKQKWQKTYYLGENPVSGGERTDLHRIKYDVPEFPLHQGVDETKKGG